MFLICEIWSSGHTNSVFIIYSRFRYHTAYIHRVNIKHALNYDTKFTLLQNVISVVHYMVGMQTHNQCWRAAGVAMPARPPVLAHMLPQPRPILFITVKRRDAALDHTTVLLVTATPCAVLTTG